MIKATFVSKAPAAGLPHAEVRALYETLEEQRYAIVCLESAGRVVKADFDADNVVKLRIIEIEMPVDTEGQEHLGAIMASIATRRTAAGTFDEVLDDGESPLKDAVGVLTAPNHDENEALPDLDGDLDVVEADVVEDDVPAVEFSGADA